MKMKRHLPDGTAMARVWANRNIFGGVHVEFLLRAPRLGGLQFSASIPLDRWPEDCGHWEACIVALPDWRSVVPDVIVRLGFRRGGSDPPIIWANIQKRTDE